ncbi:MAG TPA: SOS response-associated peptidase [Solirubrobacteraceae bacterium]|jgi:putative SOS response-associated peptidase YedK|nr:SOS response-associated peptidase [Solirubrobacteraceae bacterium]
MCGRYTNTADPQALEQRFGLRLPFSEGTRRYNVAPTESVVGIVLDKQGEAETRVLRWGLIPSWVRSGRISHTMINARSETADTKPTYRDLIGRATRRALLPADGFYEWLRSEDPKQPRLPFRFTVDDGGPFALAALWTPGWYEGERVASATILTCRANGVVGRLHDRMPVILPDRASELAWLDPDVDGQAAREMCEPLADERMHVGAANPAVNKSGGPEGPELLALPTG